MVVERKTTDPDHVTVEHPGPGEKSRHTQLRQPLVDVRQSIGSRDVVQVDGALDLATVHAPLTLVDALDPRGVGLGAQDHVPFTNRFVTACLVDQ